MPRLIISDTLNPPHQEYGSIAAYCGKLYSEIYMFNNFIYIEKQQQQRHFKFCEYFYRENYLSEVCECFFIFLKHNFLLKFEERKNHL